MDAVVELPNNTSATLVLLGDEIEEMAIASPKWWPTALSPKVRSKLFRRIVNEGLLLPIVYATTLAMVSEIYTTTAVPASEPPHWQFSGRRRVRLQYHKSPIADIGIAKGTCTRVTAQDHLAYYNVNTNEFFMGQDPTDHYWIYLTTLSGKEYFLDCGMFTFNFSMMVDASNHTKYGFPPVEYVPAFFYGRELEKSLPLTGRIGWTPDKKFSILRNSNLRDILRTVDGNYCECHDIPVLYSLMDTIAGRTCTDWERKMTMEFFSNGYHFFRLNIQNREYLNFPKEPQVVFELDPDEKINATTAEEAREDKACEKYLRKWTRKLKKGQITTKQWDDAFNAWDTNRHDIVRKLSGLNVEKPKNTPQHGCEYGLKAREG